MNKICSILVLALMASFTSYSQVNFGSLSLKEAITKAKKENKKVIVNVSRSNCKPCKMMDAEVFTDKALGEHISKEYIAIKIYQETEKYTGELRRYYLKEYPTFLILDNGGLQMGQINGGRTLDAFNKALDVYRGVNRHPTIDALEILEKNPDGEPIWKTNLYILAENEHLLRSKGWEERYLEYCKKYYDKFDITTLETAKDLKIFHNVKPPVEHPAVQFYLKDSIDYGYYTHQDYMRLNFKAEIKKAKNKEAINEIKKRAEAYFDYCFKLLYGDMEEKSYFMKSIFGSSKKAKE